MHQLLRLFWGINPPACYFETHNFTTIKILDPIQSVTIVGGNLFLASYIFHHLICAKIGAIIAGVSIDLNCTAKDN